MQVDPLERFLILLTRSATKQIDRWEIGDIALQLYDLAQKKITRTIPWPRGEEREGVNIRFSPDGKLLYFFGDDVLILETHELHRGRHLGAEPADRIRPGPRQLRIGGRLQRRSGLLHRPVHHSGSGAEPPHHGHRPRQPRRQEHRLHADRPGRRRRLRDGARSQARLRPDAADRPLRVLGVRRRAAQADRTARRSTAGRAWRLRVSSNGTPALHLPGRRDDRRLRGRDLQDPADDRDERRSDDEPVHTAARSKPVRWTAARSRTSFRTGGGWSWFLPSA